MTEKATRNPVFARGLPTEADGNGLAAILLVESLIHCLVSRSLISVAEAIEVAEIASEVAEELEAISDLPQKNMGISTALLASIQGSLGTEAVAE